MSRIERVVFHTDSPAAACGRARSNDVWLNLLARLKWYHNRTILHLHLPPCLHTILPRSWLLVRSSQRSPFFQSGLAHLHGRPRSPNHKRYAGSLGQSFKTCHGFGNVRRPNQHCVLQCQASWHLLRILARLKFHMAPSSPSLYIPCSLPLAPAASLHESYTAEIGNTEI